MCVPFVSSVFGQLHVVVGVSCVVVEDVVALLQSVVEKRLHLEPKNTHVSTQICLLTKRFNLPFH